VVVIERWRRVALGSWTSTAGVAMDLRYRSTLVAEMLALTSTRVRRSADRTYANIITDAYPVDGAALIVERQLSVLVEPPGGLATLSDARNNRQTIIYRREPGAGR